MRRMIKTVLVFSGLALAGVSAAQAQSGFTASQTRIGPVIGLGGINGAGLSWGGRFEKAIKQLPNLGDGVLSFQASVDYYSFTATAGTFKSTAKVIPFSGTVNYHINTKNEKWDAFVGAGLGYQVYSYSDNFSGTTGAASSGIFFVGRLGGSYSIANALALYADVGAGAATLNAGVMFDLGKK